MILVGLGAPMATIPIIDASLREVDIRGIFRYRNWSVMSFIVMSLFIVMSSVPVSEIYLLQFSISITHNNSNGIFGL